MTLPVPDPDPKTETPDQFILSVREAEQLSAYLQRRMLDEDLAANEPACELAHQLYQWTKTHFETRQANRWAPFTDDEMLEIQSCMGYAEQNHPAEVNEDWERIMAETDAELERRKDHP